MTIESLSQMSLIETGSCELFADTPLPQNFKGARGWVVSHLPTTLACRSKVPFASAQLKLQRMQIHSQFAQWSPGLTAAQRKLKLPGRRRQPVGHAHRVRRHLTAEVDVQRLPWVSSVACKPMVLQPRSRPS